MQWGLVWVRYQPKAECTAEHSSAQQRGGCAFWKHSLRSWLAALACMHSSHHSLRKVAFHAAPCIILNAQSDVIGARARCQRRPPQRDCGFDRLLAIPRLLQLKHVLPILWRHDPHCKVEHQASCGLRSAALAQRGREARGRLSGGLDIGPMRTTGVLGRCRANPRGSKRAREIPSMQRKRTSCSALDGRCCAGDVNRWVLSAALETLAFNLDACPSAGSRAAAAHHRSP